MFALARFLILIPVAWLASLCAAALVICVGMFGRGFFDIDVLGYAVASTFATAAFAAMIAFLPSLAAIVVAEIFGWRSLLFWLGVGGILGFIGSEAARNSGNLAFVENLLVICLAAGFTGGFVYWLIAGRDAGIRVPPSTSSA